MAAVPEVGRATGIEPRVAPEAAATQALYERYAGQIFSFCLHKLGNREEAEDAVQQTFLNAFRGLRRGIDVETESAWLFKIAHNVCLTRRRSAWRRGKVETPNDMEALQEFVAAPQRMGADDLIQLQDALAAMPANQRKAILLREWQGLSYHEIAEQMEISQPAVETLIFRARRTLAQGLEQPSEERRSSWRRLRHTMDVGSVLTAVKAALLGGAAAKVAATTAAVTAVAVVPAGIEQNRVPASPPTQVAVAQQLAREQSAPTPVVSTTLEARSPASIAVERRGRRAAAKPVAAANGTARPKAQPAPAPAEAPSEPQPAPAPVAESPVAESPPPEPKAEEPEAEEPKRDAPKAEQPKAKPEPPQPAQPRDAVAEERPGKSRGNGNGNGKDSGRAPQAAKEKGAKKGEAPAAEQPAAEQPPAEQAAEDQPAESQPAEQPSAEQPADEHGGGKPDKAEKDNAGNGNGGRKK